MNRIELINSIFEKTNFTTYLEIGAERGFSFLPIRCKNKIAVDPQFQISITKKLKWLFRNPYNIGNNYFEETSDAFFQNRKNFLMSAKQMDVILLDGLHTFRASLNDALNSLKYLNKNGIIIMHDCLPPHKAAAMPTKYYPTAEEQKAEGWTDEWCGDVWKTIVYLRCNFTEYLDVFVLNTDYGLGIIRVKKEIDHNKLIIDEKSFAEIDKIIYEDMIEKVEATLGLKSSEHSLKIIEEISKKNA